GDSLSAHGRPALAPAPDRRGRAVALPRRRSAPDPPARSRRSGAGGRPLGRPAAATRSSPHVVRVDAGSWLPLDARGLHRLSGLPVRRLRARPDRGAPGRVPAGPRGDSRAPGKLSPRGGEDRARACPGRGTLPRLRRRAIRATVAVAVVAVVLVVWPW